MKASSDVLVFASSGTGGLESAVANLFSPGDPVVVPVAGVFGDRFARIGRAFGLGVRPVDYEGGRGGDAGGVGGAGGQGPTQALPGQHSEASTGGVPDIPAPGHGGQG